MSFFSTLGAKLSFFKKKEFYISLLILFVLFLILYFLFFKVFLGIYTSHGSSVEVPEVVRLHIDKATEKLEEAGLKIEVTDSLYDPKQKPLSVISQVPDPQERVKAGRTVFLTLNKKIPPMVAFPSDVIHTSVYQSKLRLEGWKLGVEKITGVPSEFPDLVLWVEYKGKKLKEGDLIPQGSQVVLIVGKGSGNEKVGVPCMDGKNFSEAISELHSLGLNFDLQFKPESKKENGEVISQYPKCSEEDSVRIGAEITLIIAGKEPEETREESPGSDD